MLGSYTVGDLPAFRQNNVESFSAQGFISEYGRSRLSFLDALPLDTSDEDRSAKLKDFGRQFSDEAVSKFHLIGRSLSIQESR